MNRIALLGNPNSGKSTLFNALTGSTQFVGNWPGVTVEKKEGKVEINKEEVKVIDLPGVYSLSPYSNEEIISRDYIIKENPDVVINIVDASNLERNLYLTTQLLELNVPCIVALNMMDIVKKKGEEISSEALSKELGCTVCEISAITNEGVDELKNKIGKLLNTNIKLINHKFEYADDIKNAIESISKEYSASNKKANNFIALKILADDRSILDDENIPESVFQKAEPLRKELEEKYDDDFDSIIAEQRYIWIKSIIDSVILKRREEKISLSDKIDKVLTNKILGLPVFFLIIYGIYYICLNPSGIGKRLVGITFTWVVNAMIWSSTTLSGMGVSPWLVSLVSDGIIYGVGIVLAFIPYLMVLFACLAVLEECGYMARVAFIMDRLFRRFGLSGKSFIPMLLGTGCTVQAIASTRTIENENDRRMTIFLTPFMPCATKMPVIILVVGLFTQNAYVAPLSYLVAIIFIICGGILLKNTVFKSETAPFVMELPEYKMPRLKNIFHFIWEKTVAFFRKAATIIFITTVIIWFLKYFTLGLRPADVIDNSILANIGRLLSPIFAPLGFGSWQLVASLITGYVAKEQVIATMGLIYGVDAVNGALVSILTPASAISFLLFFILSSPCFASIGAMRKELGSAKLTLKAIGFQMGTAYVASLIAYQICRLIL